MISIQRMILRLVLGIGVLAQGCTPYQTPRDQLRDPVCGRPVQFDRAIIRYYDEWEYYFDSEDCARKFEAHPARYVDMTHYVLERQDG
jgi:YHS domain-containing protein